MSVLLTSNLPVYKVLLFRKHKSPFYLMFSRVLFLFVLFIYFILIFMFWFVDILKNWELIALWRV